MTLETPAVRPDVAVYRLADDLTVVVDEMGARPLDGRLFPLILPLIDGRRSTLDIGLALAGTLTLVDVSVGLAELAKEGVVVDARARRVAERPAGASSRDAGRVVRAGARGAASLVACGVDRATVEVFQAGLARRGIHVVDASGGHAAGIRLVLVGDYLTDGIARINRRALAAGWPWLIVRPLGVVPWVGPLFEPSKGSLCWECLALRLRETRRFIEYLRRHYPHLHARRLRLAAHRQGVDASAAAAAAWCRRGAAAIKKTSRAAWADRLHTIDTRTGLAQSHAVVRRPDCPRCGCTYRPPSRRRGSASAIADLQASLARHVSPITGIVGGVSLRSRPGAPACAAVAVHVFGPEIEDIRSLWRGFRRATAGGGATDAQARISAVCEAIERYSGVYRDTDRGRRATLAALGEDAIHPNDVMGFSPAQIAGRRAWNAAHPGGFSRVPEPFDERETRAWTALRSLVSGRQRWLPTASCYFGARPERERRACRADSNGCAAGETLDDAIARGFLELVERDAVGIWWHNRLERPGVDLRTVSDSFVQSVVRLHRRMTRDLRVLDVTTDLDVPAFAALSSDAGTWTRRLTVGFGAHFDPRRALRHALIELNLFLPELAEGRRRALFGGPEPSGAYLRPSGLMPWASFTSGRASTSDDAIAHVRAVAVPHGLDVLVLDQARPDIGIPVARVVVPGLCHFWPRWAPARLYAVPVAMGWRTRPSLEAELNPSAILL